MALGVIVPRTYKPKTTRKNRSSKPQALPQKFKPGCLTKLDGRTEIARALLANRDAIIADIGGVADIGHIKAGLIERYCWLEAILQSLEFEMANDKEKMLEGLSRWIQAVNSLSGLAKTLGIERRACARPWLGPAIDVTQTEPEVPAPVAEAP
jgi:hypothetical protein